MVVFGPVDRRKTRQCVAASILCSSMGTSKHPRPPPPPTRRCYGKAQRGGLFPLRRRVYSRWLPWERFVWLHVGRRRRGPRLVGRGKIRLRPPSLPCSRCSKGIHNGVLPHPLFASDKGPKRDFWTRKDNRTRSVMLPQDAQSNEKPRSVANQTAAEKTL